MRYLNVFLCILLLVSVSRFIPHPPNFTNLIAISFYLPAFFGLRYLPIVIATFIITDIFIGFHSYILFTWGSVLIIGYLSKYFKFNFKLRVCGVFIGCVIFYFISNFGFWLSGSYGYSLIGLVECYILALPYFGYTILSTFIYSTLIEFLFKIFNFRFLKI